MLGWSGVWHWKWTGWGGGGDGRASEGDETVLMPAGRNDSRSSEADAAKPCQAQVQNLILTCRRQACESVCRQWQ